MRINEEGNEEEYRFKEREYSRETRG